MKMKNENRRMFLSLEFGVVLAGIALSLGCASAPGGAIVFPTVRLPVMTRH
jgi:hypothetical protein